jgi:hypothetical protein
MTNQRNVRNIILAKAIAVGSVTPAAGTQVEPSNTVEGTVMLTDSNGKRITSSLSSYPTFSVVQSQGANLPLIKHNIKLANITSVSLKNYTAATEQVTYIGYIGSGTGDLPPIITSGPDVSYFGDVTLQGEFETFGNRDMKKSFGYVTKVGDTKSDIASGLALSLHGGVARMADPYYKVELINRADGSATGAAADTVIGSKGSKTVVITDTGANATVIAIAAGDFLRIGTAVSAEIFRVVTSTVGTSGGTLTLDRPLKANVSLLGTTAYFITSANASAALFGIRLTGLPKTYQDISFRYYKFRFLVELPSMGTTAVTYSTASSEGTGTTEQIQQLESFLLGNEGARMIIQPDMPIVRRKNSLNYLAASSGALGWSIITINYFDVNTNNLTGGQKHEKSLTIAGCSDGANGVVNTQISDTTGIQGMLEAVTAIGDFGTWA